LNPQQLENLAPLELQSATMEFWKLLGSVLITEPRQLTAMESSALNCRWFDRWLAAAGSLILRQLIAVGLFSHLHMFFSH